MTFQTEPDPDSIPHITTVGLDAQKLYETTTQPVISKSFSPWKETRQPDLSILCLGFFCQNRSQW
jgi:hypothetical protein